MDDTESLTLSINNNKECMAPPFSLDCLHDTEGPTAGRALRPTGDTEA